MTTKKNWIERLNWTNQDLDNLRFIAYLYAKQGKYDLALSFFEALSILSPQTIYEKQMLGALHLQKGNHLQALSYLNQSLKLDPSHFPSLLNRAKALLALGYKEQAKEAALLLKESGDSSLAAQASALLLVYEEEEES
jgi:tetratricopeptide (TPR) repeat protein